MLFLDAQCPWCSEKRGFNIFSISEYTSKRAPKDLKEVQNKQIGPFERKRAGFYAAGACVHCGKPILIELHLADDSYLDILRHHIKDSPEWRYEGPLPDIKNIWPETKPPYSHPSLPEAVNTDFVELQGMLKQRLQPHWIIGGCRSVLETAVKELGGEGNHLKDRIDDLKTKAVVNDVMADWAHGIRHFGNDAVHDRSGTPEEAEELVNFTKLFLQYTFEFPARIREMRGKKQCAEEGNAG
jgi:hypothetical protein